MLYSPTVFYDMDVVDAMMINVSGTVLSNALTSNAGTAGKSIPRKLVSLVGSKESVCIGSLVLLL